MVDVTEIGDVKKGDEVTLLGRDGDEFISIEEIGDLCGRFSYEFACEIFRQTGMDVKVNPLSTGEYPAKAARPYNSRMSKEKLRKAGFCMLPDWQDALRRYLCELG